MNIQSESTVRPLVQIAFTQRVQQLDLWDTILDYQRSTLAQRLYAFGVVILEEDLLVCGELAPFESHPLLKALLEHDLLDRNRLQRISLYSLWPNREESDLIEDAVAAITRRRPAERLRETIERATGVALPDVARYSLDGGRTWRHILETAVSSRRALTPTNTFA